MSLNATYAFQSTYSSPQELVAVNSTTPHPPANHFFRVNAHFFHPNLPLVWLSKRFLDFRNGAHCIRAVCNILKCIDLGLWVSTETLNCADVVCRPEAELLLSVTSLLEF